MSVHVASRGPGNVPSVARAFGCRVAPDRRRVTVFLSAAQAPDVLADLRASRRAAAVFSRPSTHRTIQVKGDDASVGPLAAGDLAHIAAYADALVRDLQALGYAEEFGRALIDVRSGRPGRGRVHARRRVPADARPQRRRARSSADRRARVRRQHPRVPRGRGARHRRDLRPRRHAERELRVAGALRRRRARRAVVPVLQQDAAEHPRQPARDGAGDRSVHRRPLRAGARVRAHRGVGPAVREHEGEARRHRLAHRHERRVQAAGRGHLPRAGDPQGRGGARAGRGRPRRNLLAALRAAGQQIARMHRPRRAARRRRCRRSTPSSTSATR